MWVFTAFIVAAFFHASISQFNGEGGEEQWNHGGEVGPDGDVIIVISDDPEPNDGWEPYHDAGQEGGVQQEYFGELGPQEGFGGQESSEDFGGQFNIGGAQEAAQPLDY